MELMCFAAIAGIIGASLLAALWAGVGMLTSLGAPTADQVQGLLLIGGCGLPIVGGIIALLSP